MPRYYNDDEDDTYERRRRRHSTSPESEVYQKRRRSRSRDRKHSERGRVSLRRDRSFSPRRRSRDQDEDSRRHRHDEYRRRRSRSRSGSRDRRRSSRGRHRRPRYKDDSPPSHRRRRRYSRSRSPRRSTQSPSAQSRSKRSNAPLPSQKDAFRGDVSKTSPPPEKQKPNFSNTGKLAAETNTVTVAGSNPIVLKYHEPPEARKPPAKDAWRLYVFKGPDLLETVDLGDRSCWLIGREKFVADFPVDHPSCSKQHAVIQFRFVDKKNEFGDRIGGVKPYVIDLGSSNGTCVNGDDIPKERFVELRDRDVLKFGLSTREYVLMLPPSG